MIDNEEAMMAMELTGGALTGATLEEETKRTARVLQMLLLIASSPERYTRKLLADRFEIGALMIRSDVVPARTGEGMPT